jgi:hypothetical protein
MTSAFTDLAFADSMFAALTFADSTFADLTFADLTSPRCIYIVRHMQIIRPHQCSCYILKNIFFKCFCDNHTTTSENHIYMYSLFIFMKN